MSDLTLEDLRPLISAMFANPDWSALTDHPDSLREEASSERTAIADADRVLTAPDDEAMTSDLLHALSRALGFDPFEVDIPGIAGDLPLEEIVWTAGRYRALLGTLTPHGIDRPLLLVRNRSEWRARFYEAAHALRTYSPTAPLLPPPAAAEVPSEGALSVDQASKLLRFHPKTTLRYLRSGELRGEHVGRRWQIRREDVAAFERLLEAKGLR